ncbi:probable methyltransferase PMT5 isoform X1 [Magnolia sinica]|uniref:probable methyltransferase PMT5 isoform X1 n=1 Tax=Magnolia sinica TaxID=86752 RepID=UPI00265B5AE3|nr:probable methyltransferase PMT5 isoform X1 [Magnolia sinica]
MRKPWAHQPSVDSGRAPPLHWWILCFFGVLAFIAVLGKLPSSGDSDSVTDVYKNYRRLRVQAGSDFSEVSSLLLGLSQANELDLCGKEREDYVPCYNVSANCLAGFCDGEEFDRHCKASGVGLRCLVQPPKDYKIPLKWPVGRDVIWSGNVKIAKDQFLSSGSMTKRLMFLEENQIAFHSEDGMNTNGVRDYSHQIAKMIGLGSDSEFLEAGVRTVLDIGCGFGSFGAHLFSLNLMTVCIAAYEVSGSQVQLTLERGLPAMIGSFISKQLPYPSLSFDMVHCAQCGIKWDTKDGAFLIEVDRMLKPGGYFVLTSPTSKPQPASQNGKNRIMFMRVEDFTQKICWSLLSQQDETFIWQKTADINCFASRKQGGIPPVCKDEKGVESYYQPLLSCIIGNTSRRWIPIQNRSYWHTDAQLSSYELALHGKYCFGGLFLGPSRGFS